MCAAPHDYYGQNSYPQQQLQTEQYQPQASSNSFSSVYRNDLHFNQNARPPTREYNINANSTGGISEEQRRQAWSMYQQQQTWQHPQVRNVPAWRQHQGYPHQSMYSTPQHIPIHGFVPQHHTPPQFHHTTQAYGIPAVNKPSFNLPKISAEESNSWPPALQDYVKRAYAMDPLKNKHSLISKIIRTMVQNAVHDNTIWSTDWRLKPLPNLSKTYEKSDIPLNIGDQPHVRDNQMQRPQNSHLPTQSPYVYTPPTVGFKYTPPTVGFKYTPPTAGFKYTPPTVGFKYTPPTTNTHPPQQPSFVYIPPKQSNSNNKKRNNVHFMKTAKRKKKKGKSKKKKGTMPGDDDFYASQNIAANKIKRKALHSLLVDSIEILKRDDRALRFSRAVQKQNVERAQVDASELRRIVGATRDAIVGTCLNLEKRYFRLTSAPKPELVRPEPVLKKTMEMLDTKWFGVSKDKGTIASNSISNDTLNNRPDYIYMCEQLKSVRQDLTVQHIANNFTARVYETHARIALECNDINEFNQCQTQLIHLYDRGIIGSLLEFTAYRIIYYIYNRSVVDMNKILAKLTPSDRKDQAVAHALAIRRAVAFDNYHLFFKLYKLTPNLGNKLVELLVPGMRAKALIRISRSYRPTVSISFLTEELAFKDCDIEEEVESKLDSSESFNSKRKKNSQTKSDSHKVIISYTAKQLCVKMLKQYSAVFTDEKELLIDTTKSQSFFSKLSTTWGSGLL